jgi:hypothetical protein
MSLYLRKSNILNSEQLVNYYLPIIDNNTDVNITFNYKWHFPYRIVNISIKSDNKNVTIKNKYLFGLFRFN